MDKWGALRLGFSLEHLNKDLADSRAAIAKQIQSMLVRSVATSLVFIELGAALAL